MEWTYLLLGAFLLHGIKAQRGYDYNKPRTPFNPGRDSNDSRFPSSRPPTGADFFTPGAQEQFSSLGPSTSPKPFDSQNQDDQGPSSPGFDRESGNRRQGGRAFPAPVEDQFFTREPNRPSPGLDRDRSQGQNFDQRPGDEEDRNTPSYSREQGGRPFPGPPEDQFSRGQNRPSSSGQEERDRPQGPQFSGQNFDRRNQRPSDEDSSTPSYSRDQGGRAFPGPPEDQFFSRGQNRPSPAGQEDRNRPQGSQFPGQDFDRRNPGQQGQFPSFSGSRPGTGNRENLPRQEDSDGTYDEGDYSAIPGEPDKDYPIYSEIPQTSFKCNEQQYPGYYADVEARCQVFHICANNRTYDFLCPNGTIFHQQHLVCVWWNQFDCNDAPGLFGINANIYDYSINGENNLSTPQQPVGSTRPTGQFPSFAGTRPRTDDFSNQGFQRPGQNEPLDSSTPNYYRQRPGGQPQGPKGRDFAPGFSNSEQPETFQGPRGQPQDNQGQGLQDFDESQGPQRHGGQQPFNRPQYQPGQSQRPGDFRQDQPQGQDFNGFRRPEEPQRFDRPQGQRGYQGPQDNDDSRQPNQQGYDRPQGSRGLNGPEESQDSDRRPEEPQRFDRPQGQRGYQGPQDNDGSRQPNQQGYDRPQGSRGLDRPEESQDSDRRPGEPQQFGRPQNQRGYQGSQDEAQQNPQRYDRPQGSRGLDRPEESQGSDKPQDFNRPLGNQDFDKSQGYPRDRPQKPFTPDDYTTERNSFNGPRGYPSERPQEPFTPGGYTTEKNSFNDRRGYSGQRPEEPSRNQDNYSSSTSPRFPNVKFQQPTTPSSRAYIPPRRPEFGRSFNQQGPENQFPENGRTSSKYPDSYSTPASQDFDQFPERQSPEPEGPNGQPSRSRQQPEDYRRPGDFREQTRQPTFSSQSPKSSQGPDARTQQYPESSQTPTDSTDSFPSTRPGLTSPTTFDQRPGSTGFTTQSPRGFTGTTTIETTTDQPSSRFPKQFRGSTPSNTSKPSRGYLPPENDQ